jgi:transposase
MVKNPNSVELHTPHTCEHCQALLDNVAPFREECRQVFDIPPIQINVTEHRVQYKVCPICNQVNQGSFPARVDAPTQYG